jgi:hypothetical protein
MACSHRLWHEAAAQLLMAGGAQCQILQQVVHGIRRLYLYSTGLRLTSSFCCCYCCYCCCCVSPGLVPRVQGLWCWSPLCAILILHAPFKQP